MANPGEAVGHLRKLGWAAIALERVIVLPNTVGALFTPGDGAGLRTELGIGGKQILLEDLKRRGVGGFRAGIGPRTRGQSLHKLLMKRRRLRAESLISLPVAGKQRGDRR